MMKTDDNDDTETGCDAGDSSSFSLQYAVCDALMAHVHLRYT